MDHVSAWTRGGRSVALTAAPYGVDDEEREELAAWVEDYPRLSLAYGRGWYGFDTTQVPLLRSDRIPVVEPA
ncbi:hypothetical protein ACIRL2_40560 [Embleya sp. NPDC127516]|uniref:hypothetical protein n=1 Tax=Embleya sp. NPDC127516 TaxID=3363990 RepID=UPI00381FC4F0